MTFPIREDFPGLSVTCRTLLTGQQASVCRVRQRVEAGDCAQGTPSLFTSMPASDEAPNRRSGLSA